MRNLLSTNYALPIAANVQDDLIRSRILTIRGVQVMLDRDLAELYGVETKVLNQAVKRNRDRFPERFMFQLAKGDIEALRPQIVTSNVETGLRSQIVTLNKGQGQHLKYMPYAFTEQGIAMLSAVLRSDTAVMVSIRIMDVFVAMRRTLATLAPILPRIEAVERRQLKQEEAQKRNEERFDVIFKAMDFLLDSDATKQNILDALEWLSGQMHPGDIILFHFSGHGARGGYLACYDSHQYADTYLAASELSERFSSFLGGVGLVCIIDACYSTGMIPRYQSRGLMASSGVSEVDGVDFGQDFAERVSQCMDKICSAQNRKSSSKGGESEWGRLAENEVGWITSSQANQVSYDGVFTTECLCNKGWIKGRADGINVEPSDGKVTFGELALWGRQWMRQNYDKYRIMADYRNFAVLDNIVAGRVPRSGTLAFLMAPPAVEVEQDSDGMLKVSWDAVEGAKAYNVFRVVNGSSETNFVATVSGLSYVDGKDSALDPSVEYVYYVRAENEDDISMASAAMSGTAVENLQLRDFVSQHMTDERMAALSLSENLPVEGGVVNYSNLNYDHDGDGFTTFQEFVIGSDPANGQSAFIGKIALEGDEPVITWDPDLGEERKYSVYGKENLSDEVWQDVTDDDKRDYRFFKVKVELP